MQIMKSSLWFSDSQVGTASTRLPKALRAPYREAVMVPFCLTAETAFPSVFSHPGEPAELGISVLRVVASFLLNSAGIDQVAA